MSPYLHIPLSRHHQTTRRPRWVVWLMAAGVLLGLFVIWKLSVSWFTNTTILKAAPEGTQTAVQLFINHRTWPVLNEVLGNVPLISNRNLTLGDLTKFTRGEIAWFLMENGERSVAIRSKDELLPTAILDANHVVVQKITSEIFLLSEKLQPISGIDQKWSFAHLLPSFSMRVGSYIDRETQKLTKITNKEHELTITLPFSYPAMSTFDSSSIPDGGYLVLLTPVFTKMDNLIDQLIFNDLLTTNGIIILKDARSPSFLVSSEQQIEESERIRLVQTALALKYPTKEDKTLKDGTVSKEIVSDPSLVPVEQRIILGREFHHATIGTSSLFISKNGEVMLSDSEELIKKWLSKAPREDVSEICNANVGYISVQKLLESNLYPTNAFGDDLLRVISESISEIGIERRGKSTKLHMCY